MRMPCEPGSPSPRTARRLCRIAAGLALLAPAAALADRVTVKGVALEGTVESITSSSVVMKTIYGKGSLTIPVRDVEAIETEAAFHVFHGADADTLGRVVGVSKQAIAVETGGAVPTEVPFEEVYRVRRDPGPDAEWLERAAIGLAYWSGNYDLNFSAALATTDTLALGSGFGLRREKGRSRLRMDARYRLSMQRLDGESRETTQNDVLGQLRQEYDLTPRIFGFGAADAEYDEIEELTIRTAPRLGVGYVVYKSEAARVAVEAGGGYVYQRFFGGDTTQYPTAAFGAESDVELPFAGATWRTRVDYTPSVTDWTDEWLLRGESSLLVPLARQVSFKASILDTYNSSPAEDTDRNSFSTALGLSLGF
jgi:putative salt-induced outer membrane protein YdiY